MVKNIGSTKTKGVNVKIIPQCTTPQVNVKIIPQVCSARVKYPAPPPKSLEVEPGYKASQDDLYRYFG